MPYIRIQLAGVPLSPASPEIDALVTQLQAGVTDALVDYLHKERTLTVVSVGSDDCAHWSADGRPLAGRGAAVQAFITAGTNNSAEKAAFIAACYDLLAAVLGPLSAPTYVVVQEVPAGDWGYDGLSQAARKQQREKEGEVQS
ncbi:MAG TPA: hypothetical protein VL968_04605 [Rhodocyclaceae bacterium]|nr:hypothetical protein [Rhodocyclaceae bacterium]